MNPGTEVTREKAECIARLVGFRPGAAVWDIQGDVDRVSDTDVWVVKSTATGEYEPPGSHGQQLEIAKRGGEIIFLTNWSRVGGNRE